MSRIASEDLFHLIRSLSQAEKRYFKIFSSMGLEKSSGTIYNRLFDAIELQKDYDEDKVLNRVKEIKHTQLSNLKGYLYRMILESLRQYNSGKHVDTRIYALLYESKILYQKKLIHQSRKQLEKAKKMAVDFEKHLMLIEIISWEESIISEE